MEGRPCWRRRRPAEARASPGYQREEGSYDQGRNGLQVNFRLAETDFEGESESNQCGKQSIRWRLRTSRWRVLQNRVHGLRERSTAAVLADKTLGACRSHQPRHVG